MRDQIKVNSIERQFDDWYKCIGNGLNGEAVSGAVCGVSRVKMRENERTRTRVAFEYFCS